jgi:riboflavin kinase/FMN adenylyltransferase
MRIWTGLNQDSQNFQGGTLTIGKFDGLHLGHQKLLQTLTGGPRLVMSFDPLPIQVLRPDQGYKRLLPKEDLGEQLPRFAVDALLVLPFTKELAGKSAADFAEQVIWQPFRPRHLVVGYDFAMGKDRQGDLAWLRGWCSVKGLEFTVAEPFQLEGQTVSSGRVRELIQKGDVAAAARLLGRPFYVRGEVIAGAGRGRSIGVPTLNQKPVNETLPDLGVYASRTRWRGQTLDSVTNVGRVPTFTDQTKVHVETHVFGRDVSAYGDTVDVDLVQRLRPEKKFSSAEDLKNQIAQDILEAKRILG